MLNLGFDTDSTGDFEFISLLGIWWSYLRVNDESEKEEDVDNCKSNKRVCLCFVFKGVVWFISFFLDIFALLHHHQGGRHRHQAFLSLSVFFQSLIIQSVFLRNVPDLRVF